MTQSEIYDRILKDLVTSGNMSTSESVKKIRELAYNYLREGGKFNFPRYISIHYPQYYKELEK